MAGGLLGLIAFAATPSRFAASAQMTIASEKQASAAARLAGFAAQLGLGAALAGGGDAPELFVSVAESRDVVERMLADTACGLRTPCDRISSIIDAPADSSRSARERQYRLLRRRLSVEMNARLGLLTFSAWADSPEAAEGLLRAHLRAFSDRVISRRESHARNERQFAEHRLAELRTKLRQVGDSLSDFYDQNRAFNQAPRLRFRERQLAEQLGIWQELVSNMARQVELARLDEARDTPVISFIQQPYASPRRVFPRGSVFLLGGAALGFLLGGGLVAATLFRSGRLRAFALGD